jgi:hypothetical protein
MRASRSLPGEEEASLLRAGMPNNSMEAIVQKVGAAIINRTSANAARPALDTLVRCVIQDTAQLTTAPK